MLLISEEKLREMLDEFADDAYGVFEGSFSTPVVTTLEWLIDKFIEECKKK